MVYVCSGNDTVNGTAFYVRGYVKYQGFLSLRVKVYRKLHVRQLFINVSKGGGIL